MLCENGSNLMKPFIVNKAAEGWETVITGRALPKEEGESKQSLTSPLLTPSTLYFGNMVCEIPETDATRERRFL